MNNPSSDRLARLEREYADLREQIAPLLIKNEAGKITPEERRTLLLLAQRFTDNQLELLRSVGA